MKTGEKKTKGPIDKFNLAAVKAWEHIGVEEPTEFQIQSLEETFRKLARRDRMFFLKIIMPRSILFRTWKKIERA